MSVTAETLAQLEDHWAVSAVKLAERRHARDLVDSLTVGRAVGEQLNLVVSLTTDDRELLHRVMAAYEIAALEGLHATTRMRMDEDSKELRAQAEAGAFRAYGVARVLELPDDPEDRALFVLRLGALAYCGDRWSDMRRWLFESDSNLSLGPLPEAWDRRTLHRVYGAWIALFRKRDWSDLSTVAESVAQLRQEQSAYEAALLSLEDHRDAAATAMRLVAMYHWAKATELLGEYMLQGQPASIRPELDKHFEAAVDAASASFDPSLEMLMRWLHATALGMVSGWRRRRPYPSGADGIIAADTHPSGADEIIDGQ